MKLTFLTFAPLNSASGHTARLLLELEYLSLINEVSIICLRKGEDNQETKNKYPKVSFFYIPLEFEGWEIKNIDDVVVKILDYVDKHCPDLVVMMMEVWDLMRELGKNLTGKVAFATVVHAMPFLVSPTHPSGDFEKDVIKYSASGIEEYRKNYIANHYKETEDVFKNVSIIANNKTVAFYLNTYFKEMNFWVMTPSITVKTARRIMIAKSPTYDFIYMARMESGKGVEYLPDILKRISLLMNRKVTVAILGRADDTASKNALNELLIAPLKNKYFTIKYFGWADENLKKQVLTVSGVFLYPSYYDNYPTVINEALAFGLPSITWNVPFARLNYPNTKAVKCTPLFDFQKFAENAVDALNNRNQLSKHAFEFVDSFNSPSTIAQLDTDMFKQISEQTR
jgi:glycosyltransferase involved in cell wall biosynthesis